MIWWQNITLNLYSYFPIYTASSYLYFIVDKSHHNRTSLWTTVIIIVLQCNAWWTPIVIHYIMIILFIVDNNHHISYHDYMIHCGQNKKVAANYSARLWHSQADGKVTNLMFCFWEEFIRGSWNIFDWGEICKIQHFPGKVEKRNKRLLSNNI